MPNEMPHPGDERTVWVLRCPGDNTLEGFVFQDRQHRDEWFAQAWDPARCGYRTEERYAIAWRCNCVACPTRIHWRVV